jgi:hypothetical protein
VQATTTLRRAFRTAEPGAALTVAVESDAQPSLEELPLRLEGAAAPHGSAVRLRSALGVDTVVFCSRADGGARVTPRAGVVADLETDAAFAWHHAPAAGGAELAGIVDGSTLRVNGRALIASRRAVALAETA